MYEELVKQLRDHAICADSGNQEYCGYRLPCGICRMTMTQCPKQTVQITWTSQTAATEGGER